MANPILLGQAEEIDPVQPQVRTMLAVDGIYIGGDSDRPEMTVPLAVVDGRVFSMSLDAELAPERFNPTLTLHGPYRARQNTPPAEPARSGELPELPFSPYMVSEWTGPELTARRTWTAFNADQVRAYALAALAQQAEPAPTPAKSITLTAQQIHDLASFAGLSPSPPGDELERESEFTICPCPQAGVTNEGEPGDPGSVSHTRTSSFAPSVPMRAAWAWARKSKCPAPSRRSTMSRSDQQRAIDWLLCGDTGTSSELICRVLSGSTAPLHWNNQHLPMDAAGFGRCHRLLQAIPEWRERLPEVAARVPTWGPLITAWDEITALYEAYEATPKHSQRLRHAAWTPVSTRLYQLEQAGYLAAGWIKTGPGSWRRPEEPAHA